MQPLLRTGQTIDDVIKTVERFDDQRMLYGFLYGALHLALLGAHLVRERAQTLHVKLTDEQREGENAHNDPRKPRIHGTEKKESAEKLYNRGNKTGNVVREQTHQRAHIFEQTIEHIAAVVVTDAHPISAQ